MLVLLILNFRVLLYVQNFWTSSVMCFKCYHGVLQQPFIGQVKVNDCPAGLDNWSRRVSAPRRVQKKEKSYCDYLKNPMMSTNRRGQNFVSYFKTILIKLNASILLCMLLFLFQQNTIFVHLVLSCSKDSVYIHIPFSYYVRCATLIV